MGVKYIIEQAKSLLRMKKDEEEVIVEDLHDDLKMRFLNASAKEEAAEEVLHELIDQQAELKLLGDEIWKEIRKAINTPEGQLTVNYDSRYVKDDENNIIDKAPEDLVEQLREVSNEKVSLDDIVTMIRHKVDDVKKEYIDIWYDIKEEYDLDEGLNSLHYNIKRNEIVRRPEDD